MHITVLSDNNGTEALAGEWGLSILIEHGTLRILTGHCTGDAAFAIRRTVRLLRSVGRWDSL